MKGKIFNAQEVRAILNGSKVMFREVIKPQPSQGCHFIFDKKTNSASQIADYSTKSHMVGVYIGDSHSIYLKCPYQVGQKIFCKETFCLVDDEEHGGKKWIDYRATPEYESSHPAGWDNDPSHPDALKWKPAQHMKQEHSRLTLLIKEIKVERLGDISNEDCRSEGADQWFFICNWNATHKKPEEKFEASPFCWVVSFEVINN